MAFVFDPEKNARNIAERGLPFEMVERLEWDVALVAEDDRQDYGEIRLLVLAPLDGRLYVAVVTPRGANLRVISLRKANRKEEQKYAQTR